MGNFRFQISDWQQLKLVVHRDARGFAALLVVSQRDQGEHMGRGNFEIGDKALHAAAEERMGVMGLSRLSYRSRHDPRVVAIQHESLPGPDGR